VYRKPLLTALVIIAIAALGAAAWFVHSSPSSSPADALPAAGEPAVTITAWDRTLGNPKAPVLIVEYASPQCRHCARFDMSYFPILKKKYVDTGKVYYALRVYPLSAADVAAEAIARCLPANNYFQFLDLLWRNQMKWDPVYRVPDVHAGLVEVGRIARMSAEKVDSCIADRKTAARISEVGNEATNKYNIINVPTFLINGRTREFTDDWDAFQKEIDAAVSKKK